MAWWEAGDFLRIRQKAAEYRNKGDFAGWESLYQAGYEEARRQGIVAAQISYLSGIGSIRMLRFHYSEALEAYLEAHKLAESVGDWLDAGGIAVNLTSLYSQVWDLPSAIAAAEEGRAALARAPTAYYKAQLLLQLGRLRASQREPDAADLLLAAIDAARNQRGVTLESASLSGRGDAAGSDTATEAQAWDWLGSFRREQGRLAEAEQAVTEAFRLRKLHVPRDLPASYASLGALQLAQGRDLDSAERFTAQAIAAAEAGIGSTPLHLLLHQRGLIQQARGQTASSLMSFRAAVDSALRWHSGLLPAGSPLVGSNMELDRRVFESFVEAAARQSMMTHDQELAAQSFLASETSRAASLRETQALAPVWRRKLPPAYWEYLSTLHTEQARALRAGTSDNSVEKHLRLKLTEMEAIAGLGFISNIPESFGGQNSLRQFQSRLKNDEVLLSFHLGSPESYLWTVTKNRLRLYRLGAEDGIRSQVETFRAAVAGAAKQDPSVPGAELYNSLFGQLGPDELSKKSWLLSLEDSLFEAPFAALVEDRRDGNVAYLIEKHSLQVVPGALSLEMAKDPQHKYEGTPARMVAVGDPIYNAADPRWERSLFWWTSRTADGFEWNRLPGSGAEARESARAWGDSTVLEGAGATREAFLQALADPPAVVHLATHVLTAVQRDQALVAFGRGKEGQPEFLAASDVASLQVPGALVVMTGCSTGTGESAAGAGLLGLSRAWMVAGASGVIATGWPVADRSGSLLASFYRRLKSATVADALRQTQVEMIRSGAWQAAPSYWAAYQLSGGVR